jgi:hypothetical protein
MQVTALRALRKGQILSKSGLMWTLDAYRAAGRAPRGMGDQKKPEPKRLAAVYRGKGNWFASLLALLLENQTTQRLAPRVRVQGFSQTHQIDIAWPDRDVDPLVCLETKVTGAPPSPTDPARGAMSDWTNRRKELKFAATDLKLFRRQHLTSISHWNTWRAEQVPKTYFLWAARLRPGDQVSRMVREAQALVKTYLEGAGLTAWQDAGDHYEVAPIAAADWISSVDDVLWSVADVIKRIAPPGEPPPPPLLPDERAVDLGAVSGDTSRPD